MPEKRRLEVSGVMGWLVRLLGRLIHSWWQRDRVRVSPREGWMLRLEPPCFLRLGGVMVEVLGRRVLRLADELVIVYDCTPGTEAWQLSIKPGQPRLQLTLFQAGTQRSLVEEDVEVYVLRR